MATTEDTPALEAAAVPETVTVTEEPGVASTVRGLQSIHYWLDCVYRKAAASAAREGIGITERADLKLIEQFAEYGLHSFRQLNDTLISKALGG